MWHTLESFETLLIWFRSFDVKVVFDFIFLSYLASGWNLWHSPKIVYEFSLEIVFCLVDLKRIPSIIQTAGQQPNNPRKLYMPAMQVRFPNSLTFIAF